MGYEHLKVQMGVHTNSRMKGLFHCIDQQRFTDETFRHMAGNTFAAPCFIVVFIAVVPSLCPAQIEQFPMKRIALLSRAEEVLECGVFVPELF